LPKPHIVKETAKIQDLQDPTAKMSKSSPSGCINLLDPLKTTEKKIKSAVTDSDSVVAFDPGNKPGVSNLLTILSAYSGNTVNELVEGFAGRMYGDLKKQTAEAVLAFAEPFQAKVNELLGDKPQLQRDMQVGAEQAREVASQTLAAVYSKIGFNIS
jgi:tryptophanyl-tRNA synthetase